MNLQETALFIKNHPSTHVRVAIADLDGILRGKLIHRNKFLEILESGFGFCDVIFGWDSSDALYPNGQLTGWHTGFPDAIAHIDIATLRQIPWDHQTPFFLADLSQIQHIGCPRTVLKKITAKAAQMGLKVKAAHELEWFMFKRDLEDPLAKQPVSNGMFGYSMTRISQQKAFIQALISGMEALGVPIEATHTETGPGAWEASIRPAQVLEAADRGIIFKSAIKELASSYGLTPSFMAKWNQQLPGCGGHIHISLWGDQGSLFFDANAPYHMSEIMKQFIAGQLKALPYLLPFYAPNINSYKRYVSGSWAPNTVSWGLENRTTAIRVIHLNEKSIRAEMRVPGADANPYLAMAAALASGLYGIENKLQLEDEPITGSSYHTKNRKSLPGSLKEAVEEMKKSELAKSLFGEAFIDHFSQSREWEITQYEQHVSDWELNRYFEII